MRARRWPSGHQLHGSELVQGYEELCGPGPTPREVQSAPPGRVRQVGRGGEVALAQGLGGGEGGVATADAAEPAGQVVGDRVESEPGTVGPEASRGQVVEADAVLEVPDGVLHLGVAAVIGLEGEQLAVTVG